ncbi:MAG: segregation/condensation protein A [Bacteroidia bacterium]|nr:segregation/condensation protein A [Bacteroidia bacterium]MCE7955585.1 chromosome segregation protein ScpA [Bacteroidetes bacterium CHB6]HNT82728.1 segregation/condensation protein A [Bacteroidia bacterium]
MSSEVFEVKLPAFEGPFDLLLFFIERDELDIHNIPISKITDDFLSYIHNLQSLNIEVAAEFILVASTLMRIKAKLLLPRPQMDEQGNEIDPRQDLVQQLLEYKKYKAAAEEFRYMEEERAMKFSRGNVAKEAAKIAVVTDSAGFSSELHQLTLFKLISAYQRVLQRFENAQLELKHTVVQYPFTVEDEKEKVFKKINSGKKVSFEELFEECTGRIHAVFIFLALLDLLQAREVTIQIGEGFNNFSLTKPQDLFTHAE